MRAVTWQGRRDVRVETVPDPQIHEPTDAVIRVTSSGLCGSDLHLYEVLTPYMTPGDVLGHEPIGIVEEVGSAVDRLAVGDRVVVPFQISCEACWMCERGLQSQCETTQVRATGKGAALFGYSSLYGQVPGGQAELLRVPLADTTAVRVEHGPPDDRYVYLSDVLPTAYQGLEYAAVPDGGTLVVLGLGPIGQMVARLAVHRQIRTVGVDLVPDRLARAAQHGAEVLDATDGGVAERILELTAGRGPESVVDAVGMEAHGSPVTKAAQTVVGLLPDVLARPLMDHVGMDRLSALVTAIEIVQRGGTISLSGVYGGAADPLPMLDLFDKQVRLHMGQANVRRWIPELLPLVEDSGDPLGVESFASHHLSLDEAPEAYATFQRKDDGMQKVLFRP
ncbi:MULTISPECIES: alcohol dehydrogenase catalytic domain-containing protein [Mumia]|uniref:alcohol dehydrogenase catalytic domain-containing protein n=1 Tax=Mumia TaxID=1546255 RepID=UPI001423E885|nr:alcohol dehydrogenase catalytic domain-containing protein [Mumia sp. ZJ1417]QMW66990.1 alcohol dehydrogenase catalytic domain-containing protein [Mumia sp. ZJ1417]